MINDPDLISWKKDSLLSWTDFKGIPETADHDAQTSTKLAYQWNLDLIKTASKTKFRFKDVKVSACFICSKSWVKEQPVHIHDRTQLLKHEQGHFDLAEKYARKLQIIIGEEVRNKSYTIKGKTQTEQEEFANKESNRIMSQIYGKYLNNYLATQQKYDDETNHGIITNKQVEYDSEFIKLRQ